MIISALAVERLAWQRDAACVEVDPDLFFPAVPQAAGRDTAQTAAARGVCRACPVLEECREWVLATVPSRYDKYGVVGGLVPAERREARGDPPLGSGELPYGSPEPHFMGGPPEGTRPAARNPGARELRRERERAARAEDREAYNARRRELKRQGRRSAAS